MASQDRTTFRRWLHKQEARRDPIGDFASDARADRQFPRTKRYPTAWTREHILQHLESAGAVDAAIEAFDEAWAEWAR
jgi:uncharacterized protein YozE (UPF0346 family)